MGWIWMAPLWDMRYELGIAFIKTCLVKKVEMFKISSQCIWICPTLLHPYKNVVTRQLPEISRSQQISAQERATIAWTQPWKPNCPYGETSHSCIGWLDSWSVTHSSFCPKLITCLKSLKTSRRIWYPSCQLAFQKVAVGLSWCEFHGLKKCQIHLCTGSSTRWPRWN